MFQQYHHQGENFGRNFQFYLFLDETIMLWVNNRRAFLMPFCCLTDITDSYYLEQCKYFYLKLKILIPWTLI